MMKVHVFKFAALLVMVFACGTQAFPPPSTEEPDEGDFSLLWSESMAVLVANDAPVNAVLTAISRASGIEIELDPGNEAGVTLSVFFDPGDADELEELIKAVCPSSVMTFEKDQQSDEYVIVHVKTMAMIGGRHAGSRVRDDLIRRERLYERAARLSPRPLEYVGIGAQLSYAERNESIWIMPLAPDAPASMAGIRMGDVAIALNNRPISEYANLREIVSEVRGEEHGEVTFRIRTPDGRVYDRTVVRRRFNYQGPEYLQEQANR